MLYGVMPVRFELFAFLFWIYEAQYIYIYMYLTMCCLWKMSVC